MLAIGLVMGLSSIGLSLRWRATVLTAWSTPGAALIRRHAQAGAERRAD